VSYRTPHWLIAFRLWLIPAVICVPLAALFARETGDPFTFVWGVGGSLVGVFGLMYGISFILRFIGLFDRSPAYRQFRESGGDPYFDLLPSGANPDSWAVRMGGKPEPQTEFVPPTDWIYQCDACGARNESLEINCWYCGRYLTNSPQQLQANYTGRLLQCWYCHQQVREPHYGDLENVGVTCLCCSTRLYPAQDGSNMGEKT